MNRVVATIASETLLSEDLLASDANGGDAAREGENGADDMHRDQLSAAILNARLTEGVIDRIVADELIFVVPPSHDYAHAFKLKQVVLDTPDGPRPYRGESLRDLGIGLDHPVRWGQLGEGAPVAPGLTAADPRLVITITA